MPTIHDPTDDERPESGRDTEMVICELWGCVYEPLWNRLPGRLYNSHPEGQRFESLRAR